MARRCHARGGQKWAVWTIKGSFGWYSFTVEIPYEVKLMDMLRYSWDGDTTRPLPVRVYTGVGSSTEIRSFRVEVLATK